MSTINCLKCGSENISTDRFCHKCGAALMSSKSNTPDLDSIDVFLDWNKKASYMAAAAPIVLALILEAVFSMAFQITDTCFISIIPLFILSFLVLMQLAKRKRKELGVPEKLNLNTRSPQISSGKVSPPSHIPEKAATSNKVAVINNSSDNDNWITNKTSIAVSVACQEQYGTFPVNLRPGETKRVTSNIRANVYPEGEYSYDNLIYQLQKGEKWEVQQEQDKLILKKMA